MIAGVFSSAPLAVTDEKYCEGKSEIVGEACGDLQNYLEKARRFWPIVHEYVEALPKEDPESIEKFVDFVESFEDMVRNEFFNQFKQMLVDVHDAGVSEPEKFFRVLEVLKKFTDDLQKILESQEVANLVLDGLEGLEKIGESD